MKNKINTRFLVTTALFVAIALVIRTFSINVVAGGILTMRINFSAVFYILPGLLFGPLYGGMAGGLVDLLGYVISPVGGYIPLLTLTNILAGVLPVTIWKAIKCISEKSIKRFYGVFFSIIFSFGIINLFAARLMPSNKLGKLVLLLDKKSQYVETGFIIISIIGMLILLISEFINKKNGRFYDFVNKRYFKFVIAFGISGIIVSTLNTCILLIFTPALMSKGFMILWVPRILQTIFITIINSYIVCIMIYYYEILENKIAKKATYH